MKKVALLSAVAALGLGAAVSQAAVLHVTAAITGVSNLNATAGTSLNASIAQADALTGDAHDYKITYYIHTDGLTGNEQGFGNLAANINLPAGLTRPTIGAHANYQASGATANQYGSPAQVFSINGDQGTSTSDLQGIVASLPSALATDDGSADDGVHEFQLAAINGGPVAMGSVWVSYAGGTTPITLTPDFYQWSVSVGNPTSLNNVGSAGIDLSGASVTIGPVPEPASLGLLALGGLGLAARRRRA